MNIFSLPIVLDGLVKTSLVLAATGLLAASLRRASASARHLVWTLGLVAALAVPALSLVTPRWELPIVKIDAGAPAAVASAPAAPVSDAVASTHAPTLHAQRAAVENAASAPAASVSVARQPIAWSTILLLLWAAGAALILGRMLLGLIAVQWMSRHTALITDAAWLEQARELAGSLGLRRVRFLRTRAESMPMAWGIFRSSVLMPEDADTWPAHRLRVVLLHELAHVKRRDCLTHLVAQIACAAYWFNPLAWMAVRRLRTERERACDDLVLAAGTRGSDYADQLLDIARVMRAGRFPSVLAGATLAMAHRSQLEGRLIAILDPTVPRRGLSRTRAAVSAAAVALLILPVASIQPWTDVHAAAVKTTTADLPPQPSQAQAETQVQSAKPIESHPGQAAADTRRAADDQNRIQDHLQSRIQDSLQAEIQRGAETIANGVADGVRRGVGAGVGAGVADGVVSSVVQGVSGIVDGVVSGVTTNVSENVAATLRRQGDRKAAQRDPRAVDALVEALKDSDKDVRETALQALVQMRDPRIFDPLVAALKDKNPDVRQQAAFGLGQLHDTRAIEPLASVLKDPSADVREQAVFSLGQLRAASTVDALAVALHDNADNVREQAAFALGQIRDHKAVEPLISALKDTKSNVREQAAFALGQMRDAKAVEALVIALKDADPDVREQAAFALGQIRDPRAIDGLTLALKDTKASVRQQAAFALGQIR